MSENNTDWIGIDYTNGSTVRHVLFGDNRGLTIADANWNPTYDLNTKLTDIQTDIQTDINFLNGSTVIGSSSSIYAFARNTSNPIGVYHLSTQNASDSPTIGIVSLTILTKISTNGNYSFAFFISNGRIFISAQLEPGDTAFRWTEIS